MKKRLKWERNGRRKSEDATVRSDSVDVRMGGSLGSQCRAGSHDDLRRNRRRAVLEWMMKFNIVFVIFYLCAIIIDSQSMAENLNGLEKATVKSDKIAVYSRMSVKSIKLTDIKKSEKVIVSFEMFGPGSDGPWCAIKTEGEKAVSGYVQCVHLERDAFQKQEWQSIDSSGSDSPSRVTEAVINGNHVFVPATIEYGGRDQEILVVLDTGASKSVIKF